MRIKVALYFCSCPPFLPHGNNKTCKMLKVFWSDEMNRRCFSDYVITAAFLSHLFGIFLQSCVWTRPAAQKWPVWKLRWPISESTHWLFCHQYLLFNAMVLKVPLDQLPDDFSAAPNKFSWAEALTYSKLAFRLASTCTFCQMTFLKLHCNVTLSTFQRVLICQLGNVLQSDLQEKNMDGGTPMIQWDVDIFCQNFKLFKLF